MSESEGLAKATIVDLDDELSREPSFAISTSDEELQLCGLAGAIPPLHPPQWYINIYNQNTSLHPVVNAIVDNVDGHGCHLVPQIDLKHADTLDEVRIAMARDVLEEVRPHAPPAAAVDYLPSEEAAAERIKRLGWEMRIERARVLEWLSGLCPGMRYGLTGDAFTIVKKLVRHDRLITGNGYEECVRDRRGRVAEKHHLKSATMRARPVLGDPVETTIPVRTNALRVTRVKTRVRFRTFAQIGQARVVYFRQYGDPRAICACHGKLFTSVERMTSKGHALAHEVLWYREPNPTGQTIYGLPPWMAADAVAKGMRDAQEVNALHFEQKAIPQFAVLINGTSPAPDLEQRITEYFRKLKGVENYHRILILSAAPMATSPQARCSIELKPLRQAIPDDGLFQTYERNCAETIRAQFRVAKLILGLGENINRATAEAILQFLEDQVFGPARRESDEVTTGLLMDMDLAHWRVVSNSPIAGNPRDKAEVARALAEIGGATINELRELSGEVVNKPLPPVPDHYANTPLGFLKASLAAGIPIDIDPLGVGERGTTTTTTSPEPDPNPVSPAEAERIARELAKKPRAPQGRVMKIRGGKTLAFLLEADAMNELLYGPPAPAPLIVTP